VEVAFVGAKPAGAIVLGQANALGQVFRNLIDNARSFSPDGGRVNVAMEIAKGREGELIKASVEDQGPGIPPENLETIFRRFYTERPKGAAFGGNSGLGLSIARQIVTAHNGRIYAQNIERDGKISGARLVVELPVAPPPKL
jgi:two-component system sensor histidine kinase ChvG